MAVWGGSTLTIIEVHFCVTRVITIGPARITQLIPQEFSGVTREGGNRDLVMGF